MDLGIKGRWALVCGASRGLGLGCARALAAEGVHLLLVARGADALAQAATNLRASYASQTGVEVDFVAADVSTQTGREAILARRAAFDILINNAAGPPAGDALAWSEADWLAALQANMLAPIALMRALLPGMAQRGWGRVVNITSGAVKAPIASLALSNGARSGLTGFVAGLARSGCAAQGVTINNVLPGAFDTDRLRSTLAAQAQQAGVDLAQARAQRLAGIPARRLGQPYEFGALCAFICSAQAGYINGQNILIDGGAFGGTF